jgi:hypothetical protein
MSKQTTYPIGSRLSVIISFETLCTVVDCPQQWLHIDSPDRIWVIFDDEQRWGDTTYHINTSGYKIKLISVDVGDEEDDL